MRLQAILPGLIFATASALSFSAFPATDSDKTQPADVQASQPAAKVMKPHSHMDEKSDMTQHMASMVTSEEKAAKPTPGQDKSKHYHPRDGK